MQQQEQQTTQQLQVKQDEYKSTEIDKQSLQQQVNQLESDFATVKRNQAQTETNKNL